MILAFILLQPKVTHTLFAFQRQKTLTDFLETVRNAQTIDPQVYWQFREFYSPGNFTLNPEAVGVYQTFRVIGLHDQETPLLYFSAPNLHSVDSIVDSPDNYYQEIAAVENPVFRNATSVIYQTSPQTLQLLLITSIAEMKKANGFFDYLPVEMKLLENKYWLNQTEIKVP